MRDFSQSRFELQVKYNTGWVTVERPSPFVVFQAWWAFRRRYSHLTVRLLRDGRRIKGDRS